MLMAIPSLALGLPGHPGRGRAARTRNRQLSIVAPPAMRVRHGVLQGHTLPGTLTYACAGTTHRG
jgi:hypothetical protein